MTIEGAGVINHTVTVCAPLTETVCVWIAVDQIVRVDVCESMTVVVVVHGTSTVDLQHLKSVTPLCQPLKSLTSWSS